MKTGMRCVFRLPDRVKVFDDTLELAGVLAHLAYDQDGNFAADYEILMESRDNLLGLYDLCRAMARRIKTLEKQRPVKPGVRGGE